MVIFRLNKVMLSAIILSISLTGCITTSGCGDETGGQYTIRPWQGSVPKTVNLMRYQKGSNFKTLLETYPQKHLFISEADYGLEWGNPQKAVQITVGYGPVDKNGWPKHLLSQPMSSDYKLVLDNKVEYRITDIESTHRGGLGCPLKSYKVNNHSYPGDGIYFEQSIGEPVTH